MQLLARSTVSSIRTWAVIVQESKWKTNLAFLLLLLQKPPGKVDAQVDAHRFLILYISFSGGASWQWGTHYCK
ncbi:conserved hypothetical protein [Ricinus communis]|uniref:Uncharacterized protein n=1 Tax=Ricinus communis TaxID=3988 RepID=B9S3K1_RICCO|nr:conserved hypothetical protein [Ricinus communis]